MNKLYFGDNLNELSSAVTLEILTMCWMFVEGGLSIIAGISAHSTALIAFGADSVLELLSAGTVLWRLQLELRGAKVERVRKAENNAAWVTGIGLIALSCYVVVEAGLSALYKQGSENSPLGIVVSVVAVILMPFLGIRKRTLAKVLNSGALRADAACSITCGYMAGAMLLGLAVNALTGWWWIDGALSVALLYWLIPEAKEAIAGATSGGRACNCD
jgi:divalent metal cation (Fe/Co/Zn/Cd) transporter